jgi:hypothetical protein
VRDCGCSPLGEDVDTHTPMVLTTMAALAQTELAVKREWITDSVAKRRVVGNVSCY